MERYGSFKDFERGLRERERLRENKR